MFRSEKMSAVYPWNNHVIEKSRKKLSERIFVGLNRPLAENRTDYVSNNVDTATEEQTRNADHLTTVIRAASRFIFEFQLASKWKRTETVSRPSATFPCLLCSTCAPLKEFLNGQTTRERVSSERAPIENLATARSLVWKEWWKKPPVFDR